MKTAIVSGSTGYVGKSVVKYLLKKNISVLALGRKSAGQSECRDMIGSENYTYLQIQNSDIFELPRLLTELSWEPGPSCVYYNFAWAGKIGLTDGGLAAQKKNVQYSSNAVEVAALLGCSKFINVGSQEERFAEKYLENRWKSHPYHSNQACYALSKMMSRDFCRLVSYLKRIDYIHTRFSILIDRRLQGNGYVANTIKNIINRDSYDPPENSQLFDVISLELAAEAYYEIGMRGHHMRDYFIGSGAPKRLIEYFDKADQIANHTISSREVRVRQEELILEKTAFDIGELCEDTHYKADFCFAEFIRGLCIQ